MVTSSASTQANDSAPASGFWPTVSVVVPIYNGAVDLPGLIEGLLGQTYPRDRVEYLLVDNNSCDRTPELLAEAAERAQTLGLALRPMAETQIQSAYAARNTAIRAATGEIVAFTDADCYPAVSWLEKLVQGFQDAQVGLCAGAIAALPATTWLERYAERKRLMSQTDTLAHPFCPYGQTANLAVRAVALESVGLFRPHLTTGGDADLCWRLQQQGGWKIHYAEQATIQHHHRTTLSALYKQWYRYGRSSRYLHQLYSTKLTRPLKADELGHSLLRWLLKEVPQGLSQMAAGEADWLDLAMTPLGLYCFWARTRGQRESRLSDRAREIAWLETACRSNDR